MLSKGSKTLDVTSEGLGDMFEGSFAGMSGEKIPLVSMGGLRNVVIIFYNFFLYLIGFVPLYILYFTVYIQLYLF